MNDDDTEHPNTCDLMNGGGFRMFDIKSLANHDWSPTIRKSTKIIDTERNIRLAFAKSLSLDPNIRQNKNLFKKVKSGDYDDLESIYISE